MPADSTRCSSVSVDDFNAYRSRALAASSATHPGPNRAQGNETPEVHLKLADIEQDATAAPFANGVQALSVQELAEVFRFGEVSHPDNCTNIQYLQPDGG